MQRQKKDKQGRRGVKKNEGKKRGCSGSGMIQVR